MSKGNFNPKRNFAPKGDFDKRETFVKKETRHERVVREMKAKLKEAYLQRDILLVFADSAIIDLDKTTNIIFERLNEWYSVYFPELKMEDRVKYCKLVLTIDKEKMEEAKAKITEVMGADKGIDLGMKLERTSGIDLTGKDLEATRRMAKQILALIEEKELMDKYAEEIAAEVCPNLAEVGGPKIAARLIAHVGGLEKLAKLPASTIQVLGAEKALFKHLRRKTKPPKHGIIFQHAQIHSAPKDKRGKIARAVATKLAIAAKVDAYGNKKFIGKQIREQLDRRIKEILSKPSKEKKPFTA